MYNTIIYFHFITVFDENISEIPIHMKYKVLKIFHSGFRWGYGWSYPRTYAPLTQSELTRVQNQLLQQGMMEPTLIGKPDLNQ
ncbi:hypothetical protein Ssed_2398 [Shewanella sediminis HAW-EB3]|uniref:Uncharacterized protein n=1 Tax=Shewanella sediminis (strain HAW-EB3) TaxID=425104 RepID=A8FVY4_SHESH|nr:hypothetical protein Ssed_2398 [Shewanella sediminis HAW-EB3]